MADAGETAEFLDVEMDHVAGKLAFVASDRLQGIEVALARQRAAAKNGQPRLRRLGL